MKKSRENLYSFFVQFAQDRPDGRTLLTNCLQLNSLQPIDFSLGMWYTIIVVKGWVALTEYNGAKGSTPYH